MKPFPLTSPRNSDGASELGVRKQRGVVAKRPNDAYSIQMRKLDKIISLLRRLDRSVCSLIMQIGTLKK